MKLPGKELDLHFKKTVTQWDEAIPLGNGISGALLWGNPRGFRFSLDRTDIWELTPNPRIYEEDFTYEKMIELVKEKNEKEIRERFSDIYNYVLPTKLPAGKLIFDFGCDDNVVSDLSLAKAEAKITIGEKVRLRSFLHATKKVGMIHIDQPVAEFSYYIDNPDFGVEGIDDPELGEVNSVNTASIKGLVYPAPQVVADGDVKYFVQTIGHGLAYGIFAMQKVYPKYTEIAYIVATSNDGEDWIEDSLQRIADALDVGYNKMFVSHEEWWERYWGKSSITLPDQFFEKHWYITNYLLASCSRKGSWPMPLQGVWTADNGALPPWKGDYHGDLNLQMSYYHYAKANHLEEGESVIDFLWDLNDAGRKFAKTFYKTEGMCLPGVMSPLGDALGGWGMYSLVPTNQIWTAQIFERHYRFTGDKTFLAEKAYPYMKEAAECIMGLLEERDGKYYLPISSSPEIHNDRIEAFLTPNSNYDLALMRYMFYTLAKLAVELENGEEGKWNDMLEHLPELALNARNVLMLSPDEELKESHRHHSHAMAIHPLRLLDYEKGEERKVIDATIHALEVYGSGMWIGFAFTWMAEFYAIQKNGNGAAWQLYTFWKNTCSQNGFHLNGDYKKRGSSQFHYRPFTLESNMCAADALQEMLLQSEDNILELFPAIPEEWEEETVSFDTFRAERGLLVSAVLEENEVVSLTLKPEYDGKVYLRKNARTEKLLEKIVEAVRVSDKQVELNLEGGKEYIFG